MSIHQPKKAARRRVPLRQQIRSKQREADRAWDKAMDTGPVYHWSQGANRLLQAMIYNKTNREIEDMYNQRQVAGLPEDDWGFDWEDEGHGLTNLLGFLGRDRP